MGQVGSWERLCIKWQRFMEVGDEVMRVYGSWLQLVLQPQHQHNIHIFPSPTSTPKLTFGLQIGEVQVKWEITLCPSSTQGAWLKLLTTITSPIHPFMHPFIRIHSSSHPFIHHSIHTSIHSFIRSVVRSLCPYVFQFLSFNFSPLCFLSSDFISCNFVSIRFV